jgi:hypothetical protein
VVRSFEEESAAAIAVLTGECLVQYRRVVSEGEESSGWWRASQELEATASGCLSMVQLRLLLDELVYLARLPVLESAGQSRHLWLFGIVVAVSRGKDLAAKGRFGDSGTCCWYELAVSFA